MSSMQPQEEAKIIRRYVQYLKLERSFSGNTLVAYQADLSKILHYLREQDISILDVRLEDLESFSAGLHDIGIHPRSQARILAGVRSFFHFLVVAEIRDDDPGELLESPKRGLHLPEVLSVEEIDSLIAAVDMESPLGQRNRAILETLYSCGLRVSELCALKLSNLFLQEGFIKVDGKGSKQRLVPISPRAIDEISAWIDERSYWPVKPGHEDTLFLARWGNGIGRIMIFHLIKELAAQIGLQKTISPHTFRHSFATHLLEGGADLRAIQAMLGHECITTTEIYTHIDRNKLRAEIINHHPRNIKYRQEHDIH